MTELAGLSGETNQLRYRPLGPGMIVRVTEDGPEDEVAKAVGAAAVTGTPVRLSSPGDAAPGKRTEQEPR